METRPARVSELLTGATARLDASGSETAHLDAEVLLGYVLGVDRSALVAHPEAVLSIGQLETYESCLARREAGEPVAYIRGLKEFYGTAISVDQRVLIPRPETEKLVELALARVTDDLTGAPREPRSDPYLVWDVGTGSGAIPVAMALELRKRRYGDVVHYFVSDRSGEARDVATINVVSHGLAHLFVFAEGDLLEVAPVPGRPVDLLVANLPYIPSGDLPNLPVAAGFEPASALDGGPDGLDLIRRLLPGLPDVVTPRGAAMLEIGGDQERRWRPLQPRHCRAGHAPSTRICRAAPGWPSSSRPVAERGPAVVPATDPGAIADAVLALSSGGLVGIPTETVYGIGVVPRPEALQAVIRAKQRPRAEGHPPAPRRARPGGRPRRGQCPGTPSGGSLLARGPDARAAPAPTRAWCPRPSRAAAPR